ncbi:MAG: hypothetical protein Q4P06_00690 [Actinomycetaceae bacterium]|nr:hypothetical protein [Actinomycetaceae bacterium]
MSVAVERDPMRAQRLAKARSALQKAHQLTGVISPLQVSEADWLSTGEGVRATGEGPQVTGEGLHAAQERFQASRVAGRVWHVTGNEELFQALGQVASATVWNLLAGLENPGWCAAAEMGVDLRRTVVLPDPLVVDARVLAAAIDGFGVVACGPVALPFAQKRALSGRVRARKVTFLTTCAWEGVSAPWPVSAAALSRSPGGKRKVS